MRLRGPSIVQVSLLLLFAAPCALAAPAPCPASPEMAALERQALAFLNATRADPRYAAETHGRARPLAWNATAADVARCHAQEMARTRRLSHASGAGPDPGARLTAAGIAWQLVGENVAMAATLPTIDHLLMDEPPFQPNHRANILNPAFTEVGIGLARSSDGLLWIAEDFFTPLAKTQPFTALQTETRTQTLPNGGQHTTVRVFSIARDALGRERHEEVPSLESPPGSQPAQVSITDPVAHVRYSFQLGASTVTAVPMSAPTLVPAPPAQPATVSYGSAFLKPTRSSQSLGRQIIEGLAARGERSIIVYPPAGNHPALTSTVDNWYSPKLRYGLRSIFTGPTPGTSSETALTQISLSEPPPALFQPPPGATIVRRELPGADPRIATLLAEAKAGVSQVPTEAAPAYWVAIASAEYANPNPKLQAAGLADAKTAFEDALSLPSDAGDSDLKFEAEQRSVQLVSQRDVASALALVRQSDLEGQFRANLYDVVLNAIAFRSRNALALPTEDPVALVNECQQAAGAFPFGGAHTLLTNAALAPEARLALVRQGYQAAGQADNALSAFQQFSFLELGHQLEPGLDGDLESVLTTLLSAQASDLQQSPRSSRLPAQLLGLLREIDPVIAQQFAAQFPSTVAPPIRASMANGTGFHLLPQFNPDPAAALQSAQQLSNQRQRFNALVQLASSLSRTMQLPGGERRQPDLDRAAQAANAALDMVTPDLLQSSLGQCPNLANSLARLQLSDKAAALASQCLDAADAVAAQREAAPDNGDPAQRAHILAGLQFVDYSYQQAARVAPGVAVAHAQGLEDPFEKPFALVAVAQALVFPAVGPP